MSKPQLFVIGDSISLQYGPHLQELLADRFDYARKTGQEEALQDLDTPTGANGGDSSMVLEYLTALHAEGSWKPDLLLLNCGLHDIKLAHDSDQLQVPLDRYRRNLGQILELLEQMAVPTVWVRTTPVDDETHNNAGREFDRHAADLADYNAAADELMSAAGVVLLDLHGFTEQLGPPREIFEDHVHFTDNVRRKQAQFIADFVSTLWQETSGHPMAPRIGS